MPENKKDEGGKMRVRSSGGEANNRKKKGEERAGGIVQWRPEDYLGQIDRMFEDFQSRFERSLARFPAPGFMGFGRRWFELPETRSPYADLIDAGGEYRVMAEVPGIPKEKLDITVTDREIRIDGEAATDVREEKEGFVRRERGYSKVSRRLTFPEPVEADRAEASLVNGVLEVKVPKKSPTAFERRKIPIK